MQQFSKLPASFGVRRHDCALELADMSASRNSTIYCGPVVPQEHPAIARSFNCGYGAKTRKVPTYSD